MKLSKWLAVAMAMAVMAPSAQALTSDYAAFGDYIGFGSEQDLGGATVTFSLSSTLNNLPDPSRLTLLIYDVDDGESDFSTSGSGTWDNSGAFFDYSFTLSNPFFSAQNIVYALSYDVDYLYNDNDDNNSEFFADELTDPKHLRIRLTSADPSSGIAKGGKVWEDNSVEFVIQTDQMYAEDITSYGALDFGADKFTPVAKFATSSGTTIYQSSVTDNSVRCSLSYGDGQGNGNVVCERDVIVDTVPEPATLALLGLGLAGLGYMRRRKAVVNLC